MCQSFLPEERQRYDFYQDTREIGDKNVGIEVSGDASIGVRRKQYQCGPTPLLLWGDAYIGVDEGG